MRIYFPTDSRLKSVAKKLKDLAPEFGLRLNLRNAREAASIMYGYRNWEEARTLMASRGVAKPKRRSAGNTRPPAFGNASPFPMRSPWRS